MIKIPGEKKRWKLANSTDLFGNVYGTRNINFDSEGLLKLSEGSIAIKSEKDDSDFDTAVGFGQTSSSMGMLSTTDKVYNLDLLSENISITKDVSVNTPTGGVRSDAKWWQDAWYQTTSNSLVRATSTYPTWSTSLASLTSSINHPIEIFKNRNTMVIGNGNTVVQIDTSHSTTGQSQLTLPSELEVTSIAYGNNSVAIGTKNKQSNSGSKNTNSFLFIWDGTTSAANIGIKVNSTYILAVSNYQESSYICLTGNGQLLKFNSAGFDVLGNLPFYYENVDWVDSFPNFITRNGIIKSDGDLIYINIPNDMQSYGELGQDKIYDFPGGVYCYDPLVGLYHRYSASTSLAVQGTLSSVDTTTNEITIGSSVVTATGTPVRFSSTGQIGGLTRNKLYYTIKTANNKFKLASSYTNAINNIPIDLTSGASGFGDYFQFYDIKDFGQVNCRVSGLVDLLSSTSNRQHGSIIWSTELNTPTLSPTNQAYVGVSMPDIETRGYFMTPRIESNNVTDIFKKLYLKFKPLELDIDKIVIKYRTTKRNSLPLITPQSKPTDDGKATWINTTTFTSLADFSNIIAGDEVEITSGSGSGQTAHIVSATNNTGTWTIVLDEEIKYVLANDKCYFIVNNWKKIKTIDNTNTEGIEDIPLAINSKWIQFKIELRGIGVTIEELQIINTPQVKE